MPPSEETPDLPSTPENFKAHREEVRQKLDLERRPWINSFPIAEAKKLAKEFRFKPDFNLHEELAKLFHYHKLKVPPEIIIKKGLDEAKAAHKSGSASTLLDDVRTSLWETNHPRDAVHLSKVEKVRAAAFAKLNTRKLKRPGRARDLQKLAFARRLSAIYESGTGLKPNISGTNGRFRGTAYRFASAVSKQANLRIHRLFVQEFSGGRRRSRKNRKR